MGATSVKTATIKSIVSVTENLSGGTLKDNVVSHEINDELTLNSGSTPDAELIYSGTVTLSSGTYSLDLNALSNTEGTTISSTNKKPRAIKIKAASGNANVITVSKGASNGYTGLGSSFSYALLAGESFLGVFGTSVVDITASVKVLDFTGTGSQTCTIIIVMG